MALIMKALIASIGVLLLCWCGILEAGVAPPGNSRAATPITEAPWIVTVSEIGGEQVLIGNIVGPDVFLTTTYWIKNLDPRNFEVRAGSNDYTQGGSLHKIAKILTHPQASNIGYDVGLIYVDPPFELDETRQIIKISEATEAGTSVITSLNSTTELVSGEGIIYDYDTCNNWLWIIQGIRRGQGCLTTLWDFCDDDRGAGVVVNGSLVGIMSEFIICGDDYWPYVFTNFSEPFVRMWLTANLPTMITLY